MGKEIISMKKRFKLSRRRSKRSFVRHAMRVHPKNARIGPMRGGIRA